jgi:peptidoglycan hydrolase FlgJ
VDATASQPEQDMIVTATPDLVLDVLDAADPVTQRAATAKLDALKSSDADFAATMDAEVGKAKAKTAAADQSATKVSEPQSGAVNGAPVQVIKAPASGEVYRKFEAFILQTFVETMLPKESEEVFGKGTAGGVWKSMLAEQLGAQLAKGKGIGIAKQLAAAHPAGPDVTGKAG